MLQGQGGSFKSHKKSSFDDPKCQETGFLDLCLLDRLDIAYCVKAIKL